MKNKEKYLDEILKEFIPACASCDFKKEYFWKNSVSSMCNANCEECDSIFKKWLEKESECLIILKQWEYDMLYECSPSFPFNMQSMLNSMKAKGHFKGIKDTSLEVAQILKDSIIVSDDYEGFEETK